MYSVMDVKINDLLTANLHYGKLHAPAALPDGNH